MPRVKAYRKRDGSLVAAHFRKGSSIKRLGSIPHLKRTNSRFGKVHLDSLSVANIKRYGKPDAHGHKPMLQPDVYGTDALRAKSYADMARDNLATLSVVGRHTGMPSSVADLKARFKIHNRAKRTARRGLSKGRGR